jgi:hypothetical protein
MTENIQRVDYNIGAPSISALAYQSRVLVDKLNGITREEYPKETCEVRNVFLSVAELLADELDTLRRVELENGLNDEDTDRATALGIIVHDLFSFLRYLRASAPELTPPGIQTAVTYFTRRYFPHENGAPVCVVRPQWSYNLRCVPITYEILNLLRPELAPNDNLRGPNAEKFLDYLWKRTPMSTESIHSREDGTRPRQLGILSFAGLDTDDVLLYPLLAHEFAHFIDFSFGPPDALRMQGDLGDTEAAVIDELERVLEKHEGKKPDLETLQREGKKPLHETLQVTIRELLADVIAARMLGPAFFIAHAEFLKTLSPWDGPFVERDIPRRGYPSMAFRLATVFRHLESGPN